MTAYSILSQYSLTCVSRITSPAICFRGLDSDDMMCVHRNGRFLFASKMNLYLLAIIGERFFLFQRLFFLFVCLFLFGFSVVHFVLSHLFTFLDDSL